jgi:hypothetical protein
MGTCQLREKTLTEKHRSSKFAGGWSRVGHRTQKDDLSQNEKREEPLMASNAEDGQGPHRTVEPIMMMTMMTRLSNTYILAFGQENGAEVAKAII